VRKPYLAGNWKMNLDRSSAIELAIALRDGIGDRSDVDVGVAPPFVYLDAVLQALDESSILIGAQNVSDQDKGAYTGEISAGMLADLGVDFAIVGHSERRHIYGETDEQVNVKVHKALGVGLEVILCVGETLAEREAKQTESVVRRHLTRGLEGVGAAEMGRVTIAYEPVWAIGTGRTATPEQAGEVHQYLRGLLSGLYDEGVGEAVRIQYGGSVNPSNIADLMAVPDVDGALVGGASLQAEQFLPIVGFQDGAVGTQTS